MTLCILGGGVAGLSAAHYALSSSKFRRIVILESSARIGGWIKTIRNPNGVLFEKGPRTIRPAGPQGANTLALINDLDITDQVHPVTYSHPSSRNRLILVGGKLYSLPSSLGSLFKRIPPFKYPLAFAALKDLTTSRTQCEDTSLYEFVSRRLGQDIAQYAIDPMVRGICAGDSKNVSVHFIAKYLHQLEQETGRIFIGMARDYTKGLFHKTDLSEIEKIDLVKQARAEKWAVWGLENGMESLIETLHDSVKRQGVEVKTDVSVGNIMNSRDKITVSYDTSELICDHLILAIPACNASSLVLDISSQLSSLLSSIPFVDVAVVNMEFKGKVLDHQGFGFLVPSNQPNNLLGCIYDTCTFPQGNRTVLTAMIGGSWYHDMIGNKSPIEVQNMAVKEVSTILKILNAPERVDTSLLQQCIAQYTVGHRARVDQARKLISQMRLPISLVGSSYDGVGINDTILSAKVAVTK